MAGIFGDIVKGLSEITGTQNDPNLKIFTSQTEMADIKKQIEAVYAKVGKSVMESNLSVNFAAETEELKLLESKLNEKQAQIDRINEEKAQAQAAQNACPSCGTVNESEVRFCTNCGTEIRPQKKFCSSCGKEITNGAKFCPACGTKQE